jgi:predicted DNA-binding protein
MDMSKKKREKRWVAVSANISVEAREKLELLCKQLDRSQAWIINRLILEAVVERLQRPCGGNS